MTWTDPEDDENIPACAHRQGHEWEARATLDHFVLWRCERCPGKSAAKRVTDQLSEP